MDAVDTPAWRVELTGDGIVEATLRAGREIGRSDAVAVIDAIAGLGRGSPVPVLVDLSELSAAVNRAARQYFAGPETAAVESAAALLIRSPVSRVVGNFFLGLNRPQVPTRLFTSKTDALAWLAGYLTSCPTNASTP
jgi:hypothetical protein